MMCKNNILLYSRNDNNNNNNNNFEIKFSKCIALNLVVNIIIYTLFLNVNDNNYMLMRDTYKNIFNGKILNMM